jgi:hypothetical protein
MSGPAKALALIFVAGIAFGGFFILDLPRAIVWLIFLTLSYPVLIAFFSGAVDGTRFSPEHLIAIYGESLRALPSLFEFLKGFSKSDES